jgi:hypothetical protein
VSKHQIVPLRVAGEISTGEIRNYYFDKKSDGGNSQNKRAFIF